MSILKPLRNPAFRRLFAGTTIGRIGDAMAVVAVVWTTLQHHSTTVLGGVLLAGALPSLVAAPVAGAVVHRIGAQRAVRWDSTLRAVLCLALAAALGTGHTGLGVIATFTVVNASLGAIGSIGLDVATPGLLPDNALQQGNALVSAVWDLSDLFGPALGGFLVAAGGPSWAFVVDALSFVAMGLVMPAVSTATPEDPAGTTRRAPGLWSGAVAGFRLLASRYRLSALLTVVSLFVLASSGAQEVLLPVMVRNHLHASAATYGIVVSVCGAATLAGTTLLSPLAERFSLRTSLGIALAARGLGVAATGLGGNITSTACAAALAAASDGPIYPTLRTAQQRLIPAHHRAQVAGARGSLGALGYPLGNAVGGLMATMTTAHAYLTLGVLHLIPLALLAATPTLTAEKN